MPRDVAGRTATLAALIFHDFGSDELFVSQIEKGDSVSRIHLAFQTPDRATVEKFYYAALSAGGRDIEAVFHGPAERSAESVVINPI